MKRKALLYLARLAAQKIIRFLLYLLGTGFVAYTGAMVYFIVLFASTMVCGGILLRAGTQTLAERGKVNTDSPLWDKILLPVFFLLNYFVIYLLAGLTADASQGMGALYWLGMALILFAGWVTLRALLANTYLESTARLQVDRGQTVCSTGPYAIVRHPAYSSALINCVGLCMVFPTAAVCVCAAVIAAILVVRTILEDNMLRAGLAGYRDYADKVQYRLIPFIF